VEGIFAGESHGADLETRNLQTAWTNTGVTISDIESLEINLLTTLYMTVQLQSWRRMLEQLKKALGEVKQSLEESQVRDVHWLACLEVITVIEAVERASDRVRMWRIDPEPLTRSLLINLRELNDSRFEDVIGRLQGVSEILDDSVSESESC
jgi:hypothetical protein